MDRIHLAQDRLLMVCFCEHGNKPLGSVESREFLKGASVLAFHDRTLYHQAH